MRVFKFRLLRQVFKNNGVLPEYGAGPPSKLFLKIFSAMLTSFFSELVPVGFVEVSESLSLERDILC